MDWWTYYLQTIDRIYWVEGTEGSSVRKRVEERLAEAGPTGKDGPGGEGTLSREIVSQAVPELRDIPAEHLTARTMVVRPHQRGDFGRCPGTHGHLCCNYLTLNVYLGCTLGCTYCIMQSYLRNRTLEVHLPTDETVQDIRQLALANPGRTVRLGTGEVGDSLLYDPLFGISGDLISRLDDLDNLRFELKTKTDYVDHLPGLAGPDSLSPSSRRNTVIGFSLNPQELIDREEGYAASLEKRLNAARRVAARGYRLAFHFDPMIRIDRWKEQYAAVAEMLGQFRDVQPDWISLGTLRYPGSLKNHIEERPYSVDEFISSGDGKMRYLQPLRAGMYRFMKERLAESLPDSPVYLCMESNAVWRTVVRRAPTTNPGLRSIMQPVVPGVRR